MLIVIFSAKCLRVMEKEHRQALVNLVRSQEILAPRGGRRDREGKEDKTREGEKIAAMDRGGEERERESREGQRRRGEGKRGKGR